MKTTISYTIQSTVNNTGLADQPGYLLNISVVASNLIDPKIFIYSRAPVSVGATSYEDFFYTIASVADISNIPADEPDGETGFYRTDSVSLVFSNASELSRSLGVMRDTIGLLCQANDSMLNLSEVSVLSFPPDASNFYFGSVSSTGYSPTDSDLLSMDSVQASKLSCSHAYIIRGNSPVHICVAYPAILGNSNISVNGAVQQTVSSTRNVVGPTGLSLSYKIIKTQNSFSGIASIVLSPHQ